MYFPNLKDRRGWLALGISRNRCVFLIMSIYVKPLQAAPKPWSVSRKFYVTCVLKDWPLPVPDRTQQGKSLSSCSWTGSGSGRILEPEGIIISARRHFIPNPPFLAPFSFFPSSILSFFILLVSFFLFLFILSLLSSCRTKSSSLGAGCSTREGQLRG